MKVERPKDDRTPDGRRIVYPIWREDLAEATILPQMVTMIYFCGHKKTKPREEFGKLHHSVKIEPDGTCNRLRWCPQCTIDHVASRPDTARPG